EVPGPGPAMAPHPERLRWYQIPLSSARIPRSGLFSYGFQAGLQRYQQLRALKHLPVGRPVAPPPPGLLEPWPPAPPPADSPPRASHHPRSAGGVRGRRPDPAERHAAGGGQAPKPCRPPAGRSLPKGGCPGIGGSLGTSQRLLGVVVPTEASLFPCSVAQVACQQLDPLANSLDSLVREKREQSQAATLQAGLAQVHVDDASPWESPDEDTQLPEEHRYPCQPCPGGELGGSAQCPLPTRRCPPTRRDLLARFTMKPRLIPTVHPGEPVFCAHPAPAPTLDTRGLEPQSALEGFFLRDSPACQAAFVRNGGLSLLYRCVPTCPLPVLRWLFQLMTLCPDTTNASQALWEIWLSTGGEPWCPTVQEISWAFTRLGADLSPLCRQHLLPPELCPADRSPDPSCSPTQASPDATSTLALVTQLGDICKFLALCVVTQPRRYTDGARLVLVTLLSFLGLDRALRCQPLPELQHLLHCLLEGIRDWQEQVPLAPCPPSAPLPEGAARPACTPASPSLSPAACPLPVPLPAFSAPPQPGCPR
ncbi:F178B protein, partial [Oceanites oceanicus]|nr:F178B protein [Oceanites oceanicus]